jgi:16S rRNA (adenine1518-N6/adenine1519-N6)-dimethyltransferase
MEISNTYPKKRFSQNFLKNQHFASKIVESLDINNKDTVIEIGPGKGILTEKLVKTNAAELLLVEIDRHWVEYLKNEYSEQTEIFQGDFLKFNWYEYSGKRIKLIGNLPYHITSPILFHILDHAEAADSCVFMTQNEVAKRIVSPPGNKDYGILSVLCQTYAKVEYLFTVSKGNFYPVPKVDSAVFRMKFYKNVENLKNHQLYRKIVRSSFNFRRKMLRNSLGRIFDKTIVYCLNAVNLDRRPEDLTVDEFKNLTNEINHHLRSKNA